MPDRAGNDRYDNGRLSGVLAEVMPHLSDDDGGMQLVASATMLSLYSGCLRMRPTLVSLRQRLRHSLAGLVIAILTTHGPVDTALSTYAAVAVLAVPQMVAAQSQTRSSGGYTRPGGYSPRTPSFGGSAAARRPSVSGGYGRPSSSMPGRSGSSWNLPRSSSDQALARQSSREALDAFRQRSQPEDHGRVGRRSGRLDHGMGRGVATRCGTPGRLARTGTAVRDGHLRPRQAAPPSPSLACGTRCSCGIS